ncbi:MAG: biotin/lipoyl-binding protein [Anaerolineales bacterium]|nr:biotin/lipoyl-binding protein [Anaerolineales bacterium]
MKHSIRLLFLAGLLAATAGCAAGGQGRATPTPLPQIVSAQQIVFTVERGPIVSERDVAGEIVPASQDKLYFSASGIVSRVLVKNGDEFKQGDLLAELKLDDLLDQLQQAQIDLQVSQQDLAVDQAQKAYELQQAESEAVIAQKQVELAQIALASAVGAQQAVAQLNLEIAQEYVKTAEARLTLVRARADTQVDQVVQRNQNTVDSLNRLITERQLIAPYDGIVMVMSLTPGAQATAYDTAAVVGDPSQLVVQTPFEYELANNVDVGTPAYIFPTREPEPNYPVQYLANFLPISNEQSGITESSSGDVLVNFLYFSVPESASREALRVGQAVRLHVILGSVPEALLLSPAAIRGNDSFKYVIVLEDDYHRRVEVVSIGVKTDEKWQVIANLQAGDQILGP